MSLNCMKINGGCAGRQEQQDAKGSQARKKAEAARLGQGAKGRVAGMHVREVRAPVAVFRRQELGRVPRVPHHGQGVCRQAQLQV